MHFSFHPGPTKFLWFIFDDQGKTLQKGFKSKAAAVLWALQRRMRG